MVTVVVYGRFLKITLRPSEAASLGAAASSDTDVFFRDVVILIDCGRNKGVLLGRFV